LKEEEDYMESKRIRQIVVAGAMGAIAIFLGASHLGFIPWFAGAALTVMHVPVIIAAVLEGPVVGLIVGAMFGVFSLIQAAVAPTGPVDLAFLNPLVSVLPRLLIGPFAWLVYGGIHKKSEPVALVAAGIVGSLTNTVLVLGMLGVLATFPALILGATADAAKVIQTLTWPVLGTVAATNGLPEAGAAALLTLVVVAAWKRIQYGRRGSSVE
jgi:uncharacterized membrane protein